MTHPMQQDHQETFLRGVVVYGRYRSVGTERERPVVELRGEFDQHTLEDLPEAMDELAVLGRPMLVDLAGVTFLGVGAVRELAISSQLYEPTSSAQPFLAGTGERGSLRF